MLPFSQLFPLPDVCMDQIEITGPAIILSVHLETQSASCLACGELATRVQSRYTRTLQDLPWVGRVLRLRVQVRRFFCENPRCERQIFAERLPELTTPYARRTTRCTEALAELGFALGGKAGAHLGTFLGLPGSRMTLLRILRRISAPSACAPRIIGVDEWAYRRGKKYGTILVDLERGRLVDLLSDHQAATFSAWLIAHPGVQVISRDRAGEFALGARQGAPEAIQTADRFHLVRNLAEVVERVLQHHHKALKQIHLVIGPASSPSRLLRHRRPDRERKKQRARAVLVERYEAVQRLGKLADEPPRHRPPVA